MELQLVNSFIRLGQFIIHDCILSVSHLFSKRSIQSFSIPILDFLIGNLLYLLLDFVRSYVVNFFDLYFLVLNSLDLLITPKREISKSVSMTFAEKSLTESEKYLAHKHVAILHRQIKAAKFLIM